MKITFWGVRGSIPCPARSHVHFGGNTSCVHVAVGGEDVILDAGTGVRGLGRSFQMRGVTRATLLLSHTHWDHICGFPFFTPAYDPKWSMRILAGHLPRQGGIRSVLASQMTDPMFPVPLEAMRGASAFEDFSAGDTFTLGRDVVIKTAPLQHPNGATGYRIEHGGVSFCYVTDTEHKPGQLDQNILGLIEGADLVLYDSTYSDDEFLAKVGWGHSTWQEGIRLCRAAGAKRLGIFHHDPDHDDQYMRSVASAAKELWKGAFVVREGRSLLLEAGTRGDRVTPAPSSYADIRSVIAGQR
jgi:phosphoribosyl 1,2-cyclic phosphodiesterase